jgi:tRNA1Val (adenine37-N6)-methyltransferase
MPMPPDSADLDRRKATLAHQLGDAMTCDGLTRDFVMFQRRRGHRHSTDDLLTAWYAVTQLPALGGSPGRLLDLGSGIGSIGLAVLWYALTRPVGAGVTAKPHLTAIEAQDVSFRLLQENIDVNGVCDSARAIHGDLRDATLLPGDAAFDLITGSPPYFDVKAGIVSADSQRAHARFELRGDVRDYARSAVRLLAPQGRFVLCFPTAQRARAEDACTAAGFAVVSTCDVVPKEGAAPLFSLFACVHAVEAATSPPSANTTFIVRDRDGLHTSALIAVRACFGFTYDVRNGPPPAHAP